MVCRRRLGRMHHSRKLLMSNGRTSSFYVCHRLEHAMPTGYYLACLETCRYVWIGSLGATTSADGVDVDLVSSFCLAHRNKALIVVSDTHQIVEEGHEWAL